MPPRVKVCGLRRVADAALAAELGAARLGCVLATDSPRCASREEVRQIRHQVCGLSGPQLVLVLRRSGLDDLPELCESLDTQLVQIHGAGDDELEALRFQGLLPLPVHSVAADAEDLGELPRGEFLLDVGAGGSGTRFDWRLLAPRSPAEAWIAGGITPQNLHALLPYQPFGIDLSSGIELQPGHKDHAALRALFGLLSQHPDSCQT